MKRQMKMNTELFNKVYSEGIDDTYKGEPAKSMIISGKKIYALYTKELYILGKTEQGKWIEDIQEKPILIMDY